MSSETIGAIDLHTHLLPHMDDGSKDTAMSLELLRRQAEQGVNVVCATSHFYAHEEPPEAFCKRRAAALAHLRSAMPPDAPRILAASETAFFAGIGREKALEMLCIENTRTLMLEMSFSVWTDFQLEEVRVLALDRGFQVVLVHPERFCFSRGNREALKRLAELPLGFQVNAGALLRWRTRRIGLELLQMSGLPLLGSDCHNLTTRAPNLKEGRSMVKQKLGEAFLRQMDENAATVCGLGFARP